MKHINNNTEWFDGLSYYENERHNMNETLIHLLYLKTFLLNDNGMFMFMFMFFIYVHAASYFTLVMIDY